MIAALTDFADLAVLLPVWALAGLGLAVMGWRRAALAWGCVVPSVLGGMLLAKLAVTALAGPLTVLLHLRSPSGHTAAAAMVYGGLAGLLLCRTRRQALLIAGGVAFVIGLSRLALGVHSLMDVLVAAPAGVLGVDVLLRLAGPAPARLRFRPAVLGTLLIAVLALHGTHLHAEYQIRRWGAFLALTLRHPGPAASRLSLKGHVL